MVGARSPRDLNSVRGPIPGTTCCGQRRYVALPTELTGLVSRAGLEPATYGLKCKWLRWRLSLSLWTV